MNVPADTVKAANCIKQNALDLEDSSASVLFNYSSEWIVINSTLCIYKIIFRLT
jgi:hypothetical protein